MKLEQIKKLNTSICDLSFKEGVEEIIGELRSVKIEMAMSADEVWKRNGQKEMLEDIIEYLEECVKTEW